MTHKNNERKYVDESSCRSLLDEMERQLELYREMSALSGGQMSALPSDDTSAFSEITHRRHDLALEAERLHLQMLQRCERWKGDGVELPPDAAREAEALAARLAEKVGRLIEAEQHCQAEGRLKHGEICEKMRKMFTGRKIVRDYGRSSQPKPPRFFDRQK